MLRTRVIPCLLLRNESLVKTVKFKRFQYIGDPANTCRIFNELEVDELVFLDISASVGKREPNYQIIAEIASECFMPVCYGGGISSIHMAERILKLGVEKVILNSATYDNPKLITEIAEVFGSQSVIVSIDVKCGYWGAAKCWSYSGKKKTKWAPLDWAREVEQLGAGEILITSIEREGTWEGYDLEVVKSVAESVSIPVIAHGGAGRVQDIECAINDAGASAVALGSMVVFQKKGMGVLVNFPDAELLLSCTTH